MNERVTTLTLTTKDLRAFDDDTRIKDLRLGEIVGFINPIAIRKLIRNHRHKLLKYGVISAAEITSGERGGAPGKEYWLNEGQALRITTLSETTLADDATKQIIDTFIAYRHSHASGRIESLDG